MIIGYITLGTADIDRAKAFYDGLFADAGMKSFAPNERIVMWSKEPGQPLLAIAVPYDGKPPSVGNGVMVALNTGDKGIVEQMYKKALELGASDEGEPGFRTDNFYGAYFRDLDGNKLAVYCLI